MTRLNWIDSADPVALTRQCELAGVARPWVSTCLTTQAAEKPV